MIKIYPLLLILVFGFEAFSQNIISPSPVGFPQLYPIKKEKIKQPQAKAYGDTLYYEDFDSSGTGGLPPGWTIGGPNNHDWIWSNTAPGGAYSTSIGPMNSTTASNGYLLLPMDLYNTPWPSTGPIAANNWITSPAISINPKASVLLRFEQFYRYCCTITGDWVVEVSADNINWTSFDNKMGRGASFMPNNPEPLEYDVSSVLGNQSTVYIRFRVTGLSHYFFMVDDLHLVEGYTSALLLDDAEINFGDTFNFKSNYTMYPWSCDMNLSVNLIAKNHGVNPHTNMRGYTQIIHDSTLQGGVGQGLMATVFSSGKAALPSGSFDTINIAAPHYHFQTPGYYRLRSWVDSDSMNQTASLALRELSIILTDTIFARDRGNFTGSTGPIRYVGGGNDGDKWGVLFNIQNAIPQINSGGVEAFAVHYFVANDTNNIGAVIQPRIWTFDESQPTLAQAIGNIPIGSSPFSTIIASSMLGKWISVPVFPPAYLSPNMQYLVGWEQMGGAASNKNFVVGRDISMEPYVPPVSNFVYINDASPSWGWVNQVGGVRLFARSGCYISTGINDIEFNSLFSISPNPNNGQFTLRLENPNTSTYQLKVRNSIGQVLLDKSLSPNQVRNYKINLGEQQSGLYFVSLESEGKTWVEKIVVN